MDNSTIIGVALRDLKGGQVCVLGEDIQVNGMVECKIERENKMSKITTLDPAKNREVVVGELIGETFKKVVTKKHFFWKYKGYAIQKSVLEHLIDNKCKKIEIQAPLGIYKSIIEKWISPQAITINGKHGIQQVLPITEMTFTEMVKAKELRKAIKRIKKEIKGKTKVKEYRGQIEERDIQLEENATKEDSIQEEISPA